MTFSLYSDRAAKYGPFGKRGAAFTRERAGGFPLSRRRSVIFDARTRPLASEMIAALARYARKWWSNDSGVAAVEFGMIVAALAPPCIWAGEHLGPPLLTWATQLHQDVVDAKALADKLGSP